MEKMKVGIVTFHKSHNYGALLQAVALREALVKSGHSVYYVDYHSTYHKLLYNVNPFSNISKKGVKGLISDIIRYPYRKKRYNHFLTFINKFIQPYCKTLEEEYDLVIFGSDQIWRPQHNGGDFNPMYFGDCCIKARIRASYAASMGNENLSVHQKKRLKSLVKNFNFISVRESSLKRLLEDMGIKNVYLSLDPTLLLCKEEWDKIIPTPLSQRKYILFYDLMQGSFDNDAVYEFAQKRNLEVIKLLGSAKRKDTSFIRTTDGPFEFISLIKNAEFVFTSSFHGLAFSIIYHKQFYASFKNNAGRAISLLNMLHLEGHLLETYTKEIPSYDDIKYDKVMRTLDENRIESLQYLSLICKI